MKLMIVDDSNIMRRAIEKYLADFGLELIGTAFDGQAALELFRAAGPDVVTLDITMPRLDGLSCLALMLREKPDAKVLVVSALKDPGTGLKALKMGAKGFLPKPFTAAELRSEMRRICGVPA
jgi:two-component system chemotaxis response regulator CheY